MNLFALSRRRTRRRERGSVFVIVLLALVVLTILGLALAFVTQGELQIGANERVITHMFYASDSGISIAIARVLASALRDEVTLTLPSSKTIAGGGTTKNLRDDLYITRFIPILASACAMCQINNDTAYNQPQKRVNNVVTVYASRIGSDGGQDTTLSQTTLSSMVDLQPVPLPADAAASTGDINKLKY